jgi:hypothetical protein
VSVPHPPKPTRRPPAANPDPGPWLTRRRAAGIAAALLAVAALVAVALVVAGGDSGSDAEARAGDRRPATTPMSTTTTTRPPTTSTTTTAPPTTTSTSSSTTTVPPTTPTTPMTAAPPAPAPAPAAAGGALCIGDSVMLGASPSYMGTLTMCGTVDATESRQMSDGPAVVRSHAPYPSTVIIHLGTNGTVNGGDVDAMMQALDGVPTVVLATVQLNGGRSWQGQANGEIRAAAGRWPNARLADWEAASAGHPEYFSADGIHLSAAGAQAYADTLAAAL